MSNVTHTTSAASGPDTDPLATAEPDLSHQWVVAATVEVNEKIAKHAAIRGSFRATPVTGPDGEPEFRRIMALEVYCSGCRRPYEDVAKHPCEEKINNHHLIGGDQRVRAKRTPPPPPLDNVAPLPGPRINRRGIDAYVGGGATFK